MTISRKEQDNILHWDGLRRGFYEVYYLKWNDPKSDTAAWIRYTLTSPSHLSIRPYCELWGIFFDVKDPSKNFAVKNRFPITSLSWDTGSFGMRIAGASLSQDRCTGAIEDPAKGNALSWNLELDSIGDTYRYFPGERYYTGGFPKTKGLSPHMDGRFSGELIANGRKINFKDAPAQQTHLWGVKHAHRWAWGHCNLFKGHNDVVWEGLSAQVKIGPIMTPKMNLFYLKYADQVHLFNQPLQWLTNKSRWEVGRWEFEMKNDQITVQGMIDCPYHDMVAVTYTDPDGDLLWCNNSKIASLTLNIYDATGSHIDTLTSEKASAAEFVERAIHPEVPVRI